MADGKGKPTKDQLNKKRFENRKDNGAEDCQAPKEPYFEEIATEKGLSKGAISVLIGHECNTIEAIKALTDEDIKELNLGIGPRAILKKWVQSLNQYSEPTSLDSSGVCSVDQVNDGMGALHLTETDPGYTRNSTSPMRTREHGTHTGSVKNHQMKEAINIVKENGLAVERFKDILRSLGVSDGKVTALWRTTGHNAQDCLSEGIWHWHAMGSNNTVDGLISALEECQCGRAAGDIEEKQGRSASRSERPMYTCMSMT